MTNDLISKAEAVRRASEIMHSVVWTQHEESMHEHSISLKDKRHLEKRIADALAALPTSVPTPTTETPPHFDEVMEEVGGILDEIRERPCVICNETGDTMPCIQCDKLVCNDHADGAGYCEDCAPTPTTVEREAAEQCERSDCKATKQCFHYCGPHHREICKPPVYATAFELEAEENIHPLPAPTNSARAAAEAAANEVNEYVASLLSLSQAPLRDFERKEIEAIILRYMSTATPEPLGELKEKQDAE